jgi:hypothetical protein
MASSSTRNGGVSASNLHRQWNYLPRPELLCCGSKAPFRPIRPFLDRDDSFGPEDIAKMSAAFEAALGNLGLVDRSDPVTMAVAKLIIEFAKVGERDPERLCALAFQQLSK